MFVWNEKRMPSMKLSLVGGSSQTTLEGPAQWHLGAGQWEGAAVWRPFPTVMGELRGDMAEPPQCQSPPVPAGSEGLFPCPCASLGDPRAVCGGEVTAKQAREAARYLRCLGGLWVSDLHAQPCFSSCLTST